MREFLAYLDKQAADSGFDWSLKIEVASECAWSAELRITPNPNAKGPDESTVLLSTGANNAENAVAGLVRRATEIVVGLRN